MFINRLTFLIHIVLLLAALSGCATNPGQQNKRLYIDKSAIQGQQKKVYVTLRKANYSHYNKAVVAKYTPASTTPAVPVKATLSDSSYPWNTHQIPPETPATTVPVQTQSTNSERHYAWETNHAPPGSVNIVVSLQDQLAYVYSNGERIGWSKISTGKPGYETPTGVFNILQKKKKHVSNIYDGAKMPYMQRLTWDGIALHGGHVPDYPASHGCIRFPNTFARQLYKKTRMGAQVAVLESFSGPEYMN